MVSRWPLGLYCTRKMLISLSQAAALGKSLFRVIYNRYHGRPGCSLAPILPRSPGKRCSIFYFSSVTLTDISR